MISYRIKVLNPFILIILKQNKMKKQIFVFFVASVLFFFNACNTGNEPKNNVLPVYLPLAVGNYWIYQTFNLDSLGNETAFNLLDSIVITKDTLINNQLYYAFGGIQNYAATFPEFLRDSVGYLVNIKGQKTFSTNDFKNILVEKDYYTPINGKNCLLFTLKIKMNSAQKLIKTPAGEFNSLVASGLLTSFYYDNSGNLTDSLITDQNNYYAQNVGIVVQTYHYYFTFEKLKNKYEKRLVRYKINK
jgi:hypothetical protein